MTGDGFAATDVPIRLTLAVAGESAKLDFTATADATPGPINCPAAVTRSAAAYCFLCLLHRFHDDAPLNGGAFGPPTLDIITRPGSLLHAEHPSPVCAGNTETSMRDRRRDLRRPAAGAARADPRPQRRDDEQFGGGGVGGGVGGVDVLRDDPWRQRGTGGEGDGVGGADAHDEHPQHAGRGAGGHVPAAGPRVRPRRRPARQRRRPRTGRCSTTPPPPSSATAPSRSGPAR